MLKFPYRGLRVDKGLIRLAALACVANAIACAQVNVLTANYDTFRTNANLQETTLTPASVQWTPPSGDFGKLATFPVDGQIFTQPLYVSGVQIGGKAHDVVYVATMHNSVYAIDADNLQSSTPLWQVNLGPSVPSGLFNFTDILPEVGILGTPVIDASAQLIYVVSDTLAVSPPGETVFQLHALSLAGGQEMLNGPVTIAATIPGTGTGSSGGSLSFDPSQQLQRPGLALVNGAIYVAFGSHDDAGAYHGWVMSYNASNLQQTAVFNASPDGEGDAVWQSGRAPAFDGNGNLFVITGNGDYDGVSNFGESALRLSAADLKLQDWYTPQEWSTWNVRDYDLGSSGPLLIPNSNLMVTAGKAGWLYLLQTGSLGHLGPDNTTTVQGVQITQSSVFTMALWATQSSPVVYEFEAGGALRAFQIANGMFNPTELSEFDPVTSSVYAGLAISANGANDGTGIVWITTGDYSVDGTPGTLHALDASNLSNELWNSDMSGTRDTLGRLTKFVAPTVANGRVYVPTLSNTLVTYGLLPNGQAPTGQAQISGVVNGASYLTTPVAPGELVTIYGANLGPVGENDGQVDQDNDVTESLANAQVLFDNIPAPLLYASPDQFNVVVPFGVAAPTTQIQVLYQGQVMASTSIPVQAASPAFFSLSALGGGQGAILNQDGTVNTRDNPAPRGSYVVLYATGGGITTPPSIDGAITGGPPYAMPQLPVSVFIGGVPAPVLYAGAAPGIVTGVLQINIQIPQSADPSFADQLTLQIGNFVSPTAVTIAVD